MTDKPDPTAERRDEVLKRMLATPPQKHTPKKESSLRDSPEYEEQRQAIAKAQAASERS